MTPVGDRALRLLPLAVAVAATLAGLAWAPAQACGHREASFIATSPEASQRHLGLADGDAAGLPNGCRPAWLAGSSSNSPKPLGLSRIPLPSSDTAQPLSVD